MRHALMVLATTLISAPAWAAPGLWQWQNMNMNDMRPMTAQQLSSHVGEWVYASDGSIIGSLEKPRGADTASLHVSTFFKPDQQPIMVPAGNIGMVHGKLVVHGTSFTP